MTAKPLVTVLTPFYNTADYIAECIESVLAQTYSNFEYILVDNQSTDGSADIVRRYAARDPRIRLERTDTFFTQLQNYNAALRRISPASRYTKIVQADDTIFPRCLEDMVAIAEANPSVGVVASYRMTGVSVWPRGLPHTKVVMSGREACRLCLIDERSLFGSQTTTLLRSDIVRARDPFYDDRRVFADSDVIYEVLTGSDFAFVHQVLSFTRMENDSTWGRTQSYQPMLLDRLIRLKSYGRTFLTPEEYEQYAGAHERAYRTFLARAWLGRREPAFWEFHRKGLATIGEDIRRGELMRAAVPVVLNHLIRPETMISAVARRARRLVGIEEKD